MKNVLLPLAIACTIVAFATGLALVVTEAENREKRRRLEEKQEVEDVTIKLLVADPDFYNGKTVRFKSRGLELKGKSELIYRTHPDRPPILSVECGMGFSAPLPEYIIGVCMGMKNGCVIILCK